MFALLPCQGHAVPLQAWGFFSAAAGSFQKKKKSNMSALHTHTDAFYASFSSFPASQRVAREPQVHLVSGARDLWSGGLRKAEGPEGDVGG